MAYQVLARKYRSQIFDEVVGQDPIAQTLKNAINSKRIAHAYLFSGTRGVGKTTMARILAKALNCLKADEPTAEPCCKCESCLAVNHGDDIDVIEIDGASNNGVEEVRRLRENAIYRPARARFKIYIIDEVHMLTTSAFNALLKILEEPPEHVKFIFATTEPNKVLATIQSRCQRFDFSNINPQDIAEQLKKVLKSENIKFEDDLILQVAKMAKGSMRDALSLLDRLLSTGEQPLTSQLLEQFLGCPDSEKVHSLLERITDCDAAGTLGALDSLLSTGLTEVQIVDALVEYIRDLMVAKSAGADSELLMLTAQQADKLAQLTEKFDIPALVYSITALEKIRWSVKNTETARPLLEALMLRFALAEKFLNVENLLTNQPAGSTAGVKKNKTISASDVAVTSTPASNQHSKPKVVVSPTAFTDIESLRTNWPVIIETVASELGSGTGGLIALSKPVDLKDDLLTIAFDFTAKMSMDLCQTNGRGEQIENCLSNIRGSVVKLKMKMIDNGDSAPARPKGNISSAERNEIMDNPAVKTIISQLGATVTGIEQ